MITLFDNNQLFIIKNKNFTEFLNQDKISLNINNIICITINGKLHDLNTDIKNKVSICIIKYNNKKSINIIRHSCAHLLAQVIKNIYKDVRFATGPVIKNGFYYDFFLEKKITKNDLQLLETKMKFLVEKSIKIIKLKITVNEAKIFLNNEKYKLEILKYINNKNVNFYKQNNFIDLCLGPHVNNTYFLKYFKLLKISGAYWNGKKKNEMLYRIYGTAWNSSKDLLQYLNHIKNIELYDHKKIGENLLLFKFFNNAPGVVFWNKYGWQIYNNVIKYIRNIMMTDKYLEINTPVMLDDFLFNKSGHMDKFKKYIFRYNNSVLKPMSCPCHIFIFKNFYKKSYKNLPFRLSEFGSCFRNELSGTLYGLMRLKNFTQDDGHIFCTNDQLYNEIEKNIYMLKNIYYKFGFKIFRVILSKKPKNIYGNDSIWSKAEIILESIIKKLSIKYDVSNDGAFYGPKLEFSLKDNTNRLWQCGTIQIDFFTALKLNASFINNFGKISIPVILHRAILGSIERFLGILIENNKGILPFWLTPIQIQILYINDKFINYVKNIYNIIKLNYRTKLYIDNNRLDYKIRKCLLEKVPYIIVLGNNEIINRSVNIRKIGSNNIFNMQLNEFIYKLKFKNLKEIYY